MVQAYLAGLFHECGAPILMQRFPEYGKAFRLNQGRNWPDFREKIGVDKETADDFVEDIIYNFNQQ